VLARRRFLATAAAAGAAALSGCAPARREGAGVLVNDVHSRLNATRVARVLRPPSVEALAAAVREAAARGEALSIAGSRHAMGGQQFGEGTTLLDMRGLARVLELDLERGLVEVEAGIEWPALVAALHAAQRGRPRPWTIRQKQTGADRLSLGGALAANAHGRGLAMAPLVGDVEAFTLVGPDGRLRRCSRRDDAELFAMAIGGYGLLGPIASVRLRLSPRQVLERVVEVIDADALAEAFERRVRAGFLYGDFQYATDPGPGLLRRGVFSCYRPLPDQTTVPEGQAELSEADWRRLILLSHADRRRAFEEYAGYYLGTTGQRYWSDTHQMSVYFAGYHAELDRQLGSPAPGSEMISELYVPRAALGAFLADLRRDVRARGVELVYGTIRLIERDDETVLAWARQPWACTVVNLHVTHTPAGLARAAADFRRLIDRALEHGGSYFLTYHRWADRAQVEAAHPRLVEWLRAKRRLDPEERFQSEWYRHHRRLLADRLGGA
jgi:FAD/FMN-containing dehydrogenase